MTNRLVPVAKSSKKWTPSELTFFNIKVVAEDSDSFFGKSINDVPIPHNVTLSPRIWNNDQTPPGRLSRNELYFFTLMDDIERTPVKPAGALTSRIMDIRDFAHSLLGQLLEYDGRDGRLLCKEIRRRLPFEMCGTEVHASADVALTELRGAARIYQYYLLVQVYDARFTSEGIAEAQLVALAIAAFKQNNKCRSEAENKPALSSMTFPALTMAGTAPTFYKITVTSELETAVRTGVQPEATTIIKKCVPPVGDRAKGMVRTEDRRVLLKCFEAFRDVVDDFYRELTS